MPAFAFIDASGMAWSMRNGPHTSGWTAWVFLLDTNGLKGPNKYGKDRFALFMQNETGAETGVPMKVGFTKDYLTPDVIMCPTGPCYYTSWLTSK